MKFGITCATVCFLALMGTILVSCQESRSAYYDAMNRCTSSHGSWVTNHNDSSYAGLCLYPH
jgi:hypothetical protein